MLPRVPLATRALIVANLAVFLLQYLIGAAFEGPLALWPLGPDFHLWQLVTYAFLHGSVMHIAFNMLTLYMFGSAVEMAWGRSRYLTYYFVCVVSAALTQLAVTAWMHSGEPTVGASGGIFGLLFAFAVSFPRAKVMALLVPVPLPAWLAVTIYGVVELFMGVTGAQASVAHFAHLGGMAGGALLLAWWRLQRRTINRL